MDETQNDFPQPEKGDWRTCLKPPSARGGFDPHSGPISKDPDLSGPLRATVLAVSTGFGTGFAPVASGTFGTVVGMVIFWFLAPPYGAWSGLSYCLATIALFGLGVATATATEGIYRKKDDGRIVIDEIVGYLVTMLWVWDPAWSFNERFIAATAGFFLFRFFDIVKPPPANRLQALPGGWGIVIDDVVAGVYACLCLHGLIFLWAVFS